LRSPFRTAALHAHPRRTWASDETSLRARAAGIGSSSHEGMVTMRSSNLRTRQGVSVATGAVVLLALWSAHVAGQTARRFVARLSTVPITVAMQDAVSGRGSAEAALTGNRLTVSGTFEGLRTPATVARLHVGPRAVRGPAIGDLVVSKGVGGTISGTVDLTPPQVQALEKIGLYIQIHSEKAPEGNLWGWLIPQEATR